MKTMTIYRALEKANEADRMTPRTLRQMYVFERALLARIESGDRARAVLAQLRDDAEDYFVSPVFANIAYTAIRRYFEGPQP
jgi:hypothetical protein